MTKLCQLLYLLILSFLISLNMVLPTLAANSATLDKQITFNSFTGIYHLSRDKRGLSLLTSQETIVADFPSGTNFTGITRTLPTKYQNHSVEVKITGITDSAGNNIAYKTSIDNDNNMVITTGNPSITLYGSQTFKINYQTEGVVNIDQANDQLLLNVNGRGWDQPFNQVNAILNIPSSFNASLKGEPTCYLAFGNSISNACSIKMQKNGDSTVITSNAGSVLAHQALVLKLEFAHSTFTNIHIRSGKPLMIVTGFAVATIAALVLIINLRKPT